MNRQKFLSYTLRLTMTYWRWLRCDPAAVRVNIAPDPTRSVSMWLTRPFFPFVLCHVGFLSARTVQYFVALSPASRPREFLFPACIYTAGHRPHSSLVCCLFQHRHSWQADSKPLLCSSQSSRHWSSLSLQAQNRSRVGVFQYVRMGDQLATDLMFIFSLNQLSAPQPRLSLEA